MIYIVNGAPGSGKTTFERAVLETMGENWCHILSSINFVKEIAKKCGWDGTKTPENRKFLSDLKDLLTEWGDVPFKKIEEQIQWIYATYRAYGVTDIDNKVCIFIDVREPAEIKKCCERLNAQSILIRRADGGETEISNHADQNVENYEYDLVFENNGSLEDWMDQASQFALKFNIIKKPYESIS